MRHKYKIMNDFEWILCLYIFKYMDKTYIHKCICCKESKESVKIILKIIYVYINSICGILWIPIFNRNTKKHIYISMKTQHHIMFNPMKTRAAIFMDFTYQKTRNMPYHILSVGSMLCFRAVGLGLGV